MWIWNLRFWNCDFWTNWGLLPQCAMTIFAQLAKENLEFFFFFRTCWEKRSFYPMICCMSPEVSAFTFFCALQTMTKIPLASFFGQKNMRKPSDIWKIFHTPLKNRPSYLFLNLAKMKSHVRIGLKSSVLLDEVWEMCKCLGKILSIELRKLLTNLLIFLSNDHIYHQLQILQGDS